MATVSIITLVFIHCLHLGHILFTESFSLTKLHLLFLRKSINIESKSKSIGILPHDYYLRRNSRFSILGERVGAVVHDTLVIIADTIISDSAIVIFIEVMLLTCKSSLKFYSCVIQESCIIQSILRISQMTPF